MKETFKIGLWGLFISSIIAVACESVETVATTCVPDTKITAESSQTSDAALLDKTYKEIVGMSESKNCDAAGSWKFTAVGAKACGGPATYVAYSSEIDEECFLKKVNFFTEQSIEFNKKHGTISDCMLIAQPKSIKCEKGKPVFVYE